MSKYTDMVNRARKNGMWPLSKEQAYYAGLDEGSAGHISTDNGAVIERLERELDLTRDKYRTEQSLRAAVERERDDHENARTALEESQDQYRREAEELRAALEHADQPPAPAPAVPVGWKLVPAEPTKAMKWAMRDAADGAYLSKMDGVEGEPSDWALQAYRAMLSATPTPPSDSDQ